MSESKKINYFGLGLFFLIGIFLLITALIFFSSKTFLQQVFYAETYFDESVQGLSKGSPIKYLGMEIGSVDEITIVRNVYPKSHSTQETKDKEYIYVKMAIYPRFLIGKSSEDINEKAKQLVANGLRVKLSLQGLTGNAFIDMYFVHKKDEKQLSISWSPENCYIPSVKSTLSYFSDNAQFLLQELRQIEIKKISDSLQDLLKNTNEAVSKSQVFIKNSNALITNSNALFATTKEQIAKTIENLLVTSQNIKDLSEQVKKDPPSLLFNTPPKKLDLNKI